MPDNRIPSNSVNNFAKVEGAVRALEETLGFPSGSLEAQKFVSAYAVAVDRFVEPTEAEVDHLARAIARFGGSLDYSPTDPVRQFRLFLANPLNLPAADARRKLSGQYSDLAAAYTKEGDNETAAKARKISDALGDQNQVDIDARSLENMQMISGLSRVAGEERTAKALINLVSLKWDHDSKRWVLEGPNGFHTLVRKLYEMKVANPPVPQPVQMHWRIDSFNSLLRTGQGNLAKRVLAIAEALQWSRRNRTIDTLLGVSVRTPPADTRSMGHVLEMVKLMEDVMEETERARNRSIGIPRGSTSELWDRHRASTAPSFKHLSTLLREWEEYRQDYDSKVGGGGSTTGAGSGPAQLWMPQAGMLQAAPVFNPAIVGAVGMQTMLVGPAMPVPPVLV